MDLLRLFYCFGIAYAIGSYGDTSATQDYCLEGACQQGDNNTYLICASRRWQEMPSNNYTCLSGLLVPPTARQGETWSTSSGQIGCVTSISEIEYPLSATTVPSPSSFAMPDHISLDQSSSTQTVTTTSSSATKTWVPSRDQYGIKSYSPGGKMASVYDASRSSTFRCDNIDYPSDGYYVAFWTRYNRSLALEGDSQPAPVNCGQRINFTNPLTGVSATGLVLDRCASCIGIGDQLLDDPTTDQSLVNGATVDFSRELWKKIFNGAAGDVYDVMYAGDSLQGVS